MRRDNMRTAELVPNSPSNADCPYVGSTEYIAVWSGREKLDDLRGVPVQWHLPAHHVMQTCLLPGRAAM